MQCVTLSKRDHHRSFNKSTCRRGCSTLLQDKKQCIRMACSSTPQNQSWGGLLTTLNLLLSCLPHLSLHYGLCSLPKATSGLSTFRGLNISDPQHLVYISSQRTFKHLLLSIPISTWKDFELVSIFHPFPNNQSRRTLNHVSYFV